MLFTFPSRYLFTIDLKKYLVLGHSRPGFARDFTSPVLLKICYRRVIIPFVYGAITRSGGAFQLASTRELIYVYLCLTLLGSNNNYLATPSKHVDLDPSALPLHRSGLVIRGLKGLDCSPFARHY